MPLLSIAIVGAGPVGCMLARLLQQSSADVSITIFEGESSPNYRSQGGTLDLHETTGLACLKEANLYDAFLRHARFDGEALRVCDKHVKTYINASPNSSADNSRGAPEIDRAQLRALVAESLQKDTVRWGHRLQSVSDSASGYVLQFDQDRTYSGYDLIVGADGAWSKVRPLLSDERPHYVGVCGHTFSIPNAKTEAPELSKLINRGSIFAFSDSKALMGQQMGDGSLWISCIGVTGEDYAQSIMQNQKSIDGPVKMADLKKEYGDWDARLTAFIEAGKPETVKPIAIYSLNVGTNWKHRPGLTLVGDAAHLMVPFAGEGVNIGFSDAMGLSKAIVAATNEKDVLGALDRNVKNYEESMFAIAGRTSECSDSMMREMFFTKGAPRTSVHRWISHRIKYDAPAWYPVLMPLAYVYFFFWRLLF